MAAQRAEKIRAFAGQLMLETGVGVTYSVRLRINR
jgi:hypothetical protein